MNGVLDWVLIVAIALFSGIFNLPIALRKFNEISKSLLFFAPLRSPGFWLWLVVQLLIPTLVFLLWATNFFSEKPPVNFILFVESVGIGFGFTAFLNARTETGFLRLDIKGIYDWLLRLSLELIAAQETRRTKNFLRALERELKQPYADLIEGLRDLRAYFIADISLDAATKEKFLDTINQALTTRQLEKRIEVVQNLLPEVRQQDLIDTLQRFNCSHKFLIENLPERLRRSLIR